jgi:hypothetical protein
LLSDPLVLTTIVSQQRQVDVVMAFKPEDLDEEIDFTGVSKTKLKYIEGGGQWVYWKGYSALTVYENDDGGTKHTKLTSQVQLLVGIVLLFFQGQVKA